VPYLHRLNRTRLLRDKCRMLLINTLCKNPRSMSDEILQYETLTYWKDLLTHLFVHGGNFEDCARDAEAAAQAAQMTSEHMKRVMALKWTELVDQALDDHILTESEEHRLKSIIDAFSLPQSATNERGHLSQLVKAAILRDLQAGNPTTRISLDIALPFKLQAREVVLWAFPQTRLFERITKRKITGGSTGVSIRVMKGVYWRVGAFQGTPVSWDETHHTDTGLLILTNKNILFSGPIRNQKISFAKLATVEPYRDAIEVQRDATTAKPQIFRDIDGQFAYNVIQFA